MEKINIRNMYIDLLNKIKNVEGVDQEYVDNLIEVVDQEITALDSDINAILSVIPEDASVTNQLITVDDVPAQVNSDWNATSGPAEILNKPTIPAAQVNSDWNATSGVAQILNKPTIPAAQVNSDWNASSGVEQILNKPTIVNTVQSIITLTTSGWTLVDGRYRQQFTMSADINVNMRCLVALMPDTGTWQPLDSQIAAYNRLVYCGIDKVGNDNILYVISDILPTVEYRLMIQAYT